MGGAVRGLGHAILGDEELDAMANEVMDKLVKEGLKVDENKQDFLFGLVHHAIRGVAGAAHHAIGASEESLITCSEMKTKKTPSLDLFTTASKELIFTHLVLITCSEMKMISILGILAMNNKPNAFAVSLIKYLINFLNT